MISSCWSVCPGTPANRDNETLIEAGRSLRRLHDMRLPGFGFVGADQWRPSGTCDSWAGFLDAALVDARAAVSSDVMPTAVHDEVAFHRAQGQIRGHLDGIDQGVLLHGDLVPKHVWNDEARLAGLIDWGDAMVGDSLFDLARSSMASEEAFQRLLKGYGDSIPPDARVLSFYRMVWSLMALTVECNAGGDWFDAYLSTVRRELEFLR